MKLIANRQTTGDYGTVAPDGYFHCPDDVAKELLASGIARIPDPPKILEHKVFSPPEVGPIIPFRDMPVSDEESTLVADASYSVLSQPDVSEPGTADCG